ncbi:hypothetical protein [Microtetraspora malaysiensis]|uniref:Uncharacterized protein n=1 Tax=Microtetraspora malaysiensis TaxID=161358 RepID=A0ABW6T4M2_9ACTN
MARLRLRRYTKNIGITTLATASLVCIVFLITRHDDESRARDLASVAQEMAVKINCKESEPVRDDIYFWDKMYGVNCYENGGQLTTIRVYQHSSSIATVLQDWQPLISSNRPLITGANWFAIGPREDINIVRNAMPDASEITVRVPPPPPALTQDKESATTCLRFTASSLNDRALNPTQYNQMLPYLEKKYPGYRTAVESSMSAEQLSELKRIATHEERRLEAYLSNFGSKIKEFCTARLAN